MPNLAFIHEGFVPGERMLKTTINDNIWISTVFASDFKKYETAIIKNEHAYPVERCKIEYECMHNKWVDIFTQDSNYDFSKEDKLMTQKYMEML